jgi:hypothetical protein
MFARRIERRHLQNRRGFFPQTVTVSSRFDLIIEPFARYLRMLCWRNALAMNHMH